MIISRDDISFDGNVARRLFWEKCASRTPQFIFDYLLNKTVDRELSVDVAKWADKMLDEWDKRWITEKEEETATISTTTITTAKPQIEDMSHICEFVDGVCKDCGYVLPLSER